MRAHSDSDADAAAPAGPGGDTGMLIDGSAVAAADGQWLHVVSPSDGEVIGRIPRGGAADVDAAVRAAARALGGWRAMRPVDRGRLLLRVADALEDEADEIAHLISWDNGNAIRTQSRPETRFAVDAFRYFAGLVGEAKGETVPLSSDHLDYSRREPIGVVGAIVPWNAPVQLSAVKIAPALAVGNTMVLKVAEDASLAVLRMAQICDRFLPPGVLNVVTGLGPEDGAALAAHAGVGKLSFTGSTLVGSQVSQVAAERIVPVSLELGGKNPQIVFPDADEDWVADGTVAAMRFHRQGQSCTAGSRLFVHESILDSFVAKLVDRLSRFTVGDPLDEASDMGSIVNQKQYDRVCQFIREGVAHPGAKLVIGGVPGERPDGGFFVQPTVIVNVDNSWRIAREEIFGPVLCVIPWSDEAEVLAMANDTHYGLSAFVWTNDLGKALRTAHGLDAGWVQVNQGGGQVLGQSYGGVKQSGIGREMSLEGMLESFTRRKHVSIDMRH